MFVDMDVTDIAHATEQHWDVASFASGLVCAGVLSYWVCLREERRFAAEDRAVPAHYKGCAPYWAWEVNARFTGVWTTVFMAVVLADSLWQVAEKDEPSPPRPAPADPHSHAAFPTAVAGAGSSGGEHGDVCPANASDVAPPDWYLPRVSALHPADVAHVLRHQRSPLDYIVFGMVFGIMLKDFAWYTRHPDVVIALHHILVMFITAAVAFRTPLCLRSCTLTTILMEMGSAAYCWFVVTPEPGHAPFTFMAMTNVVWVASVMFWYESNKALVPSWVLWGCVVACVNIFLGRTGAMAEEYVRGGYNRTQPAAVRRLRAMVAQATQTQTPQSADNQ